MRLKALPFSNTILQIYISSFLIFLGSWQVSAQNIGLATNTPSQKLDINGKLKIADDAATPTAGTMRWNATKQDFEGFDGVKWLSLTNTQSNTIGQADEQGKLLNYQAATAPSIVSENRVGDDIDINGEWAVVGSRVEDFGGNNAAGAVHIYRLVGQNWQYFATVHASDPAAGDFFGTSVAISGNYFVVGAPAKANSTLAQQGAAYVFFFNGSNWVQQQKLLNGTGAADDFWGYDVDIVGITVAIGAYQADDLANTNEGKVFIYKRSGTVWSQTAVFTGAGNGSSAYFGNSVSIDETEKYVVVGTPIAPYEAVFVFFFNGSSWGQQAKILPPSGAPSNKLFGLSVAISGNSIIVGAPGSTFDTGNAYIFIRNGSSWAFQASFSYAATRNFGRSVAIENDFVLIGEPNAEKLNICGTTTGTFKGKVYVLKRSNSIWENYMQFYAPDGYLGDGFGTAISIDNLSIGFTSPTADVNGVVNSGKISFGKLQ